MLTGVDVGILIILMKHRIIGLVISFFFVTWIAQAQIGRSDWSFGPVIQTNNLVYSQIAGPLIVSIPAIVDMAINGEKSEGLNNFYQNNRWWIPSFRYRANIVQDIKINDTKFTLYPQAWGLSGWDWSFNNYSVGYHVGYLSRLAPLGFDAQVDYIQDGYKYKYGDSDIKHKMVKRMVAATGLLKIRFLKYDSKAFNPIVEIGAAYNHVFYYHDNIIKDKNAVNNGFSGIVGLGYTHTNSHISWSLRYEHAFFNFYNKDYLYNGEQIFKDSKSKFGRLGFAITYGF